jgi:hypothetical protein
MYIVLYRAYLLCTNHLVKIWPQFMKTQTSMNMKMQPEGNIYGELALLKAL